MAIIFKRHESGNTSLEIGTSPMFFMAPDEWVSFVKGGYTVFRDIAYVLVSDVSIVTFYDIPYVSGTEGKVEVYYHRECIPHFMRKAADRILKRKQECEFSDADIKRFERRYTIGSGIAKLEISDPEFFRECAKDQTFLRCQRQLVRIARNTTCRYWQKATIRLSKDWDGWFFQLPGLHGGVINHGRGGKPDWSIHT